MLSLARYKIVLKQSYRKGASGEAKRQGAAVFFEWLCSRVCMCVCYLRACPLFSTLAYSGQAERRTPDEGTSELFLACCTTPLHQEDTQNALPSPTAYTSTPCPGLSPVLLELGRSSSSSAEPRILMLYFACSRCGDGGGL
jgi:hypothetical protein